jgi:hypothetical protein
MTEVTQLPARNLPEQIVRPATGLPMVVGQAGTPGPQGPQGPAGTDGTDGTNGTDGSDGAPGTPGADGQPGADGAPGAPGADGSDGAPGAKGDTGDQGPPGNDGTPGADGADGSDGAPGDTGPAGPGLPTGGTTGQYPRKASTTDFDTAWHTLVAADVTDATTAGKALLTAADAAAQRTDLGLGTAATVDTGTTSGKIPLLGASGVLAVARLATGTPDGTKFVRDDGTLAVPAGGSSTYYGQGVATAAAANTVITLGSTPIVGSESVFVLSNGATFCLSPGTDYTISGAVITMTSDLSIGDVVNARWATTNPTPGSIALSGTAAYPTAVLADSPWGFWRFKETGAPTSLADSSGNGRSLAVTGLLTPGQSSGPKSKHLLVSASTGNYAGSSVKHTTSAASIELWVKIAANPASKTSLFGNHLTASDSTGDKNIYLTTDGKVNFYWFDGSTHTITSTAGLSTGTWHHIVATVGAAGTFLYVDGSQVATNASTSSYTGWAQAVFVHNGTDSANALYTGDAIDVAEFAMYTAQLTSTRVAAHFAA